MNDREETLFEFPCTFSVKVFGLASDDFDAVVVELVRRHVPDLAEGAATTRPSRGGKYHAVTVTFEATSKGQLDALYQSLTDHERVLMSL